MDTSLQFEANAKPLDLSGKKKHAIKKKPTRRGRGVQSKKGGSCSKFSILGNNSNGLKAKLKSLKAAVKVFNPTCITIQDILFSCLVMLFSKTKRLVIDSRFGIYSS